MSESALIEEDAVVTTPMSAAPRDGLREVDIRLVDWHEQVQPLRLAAVMESVLEIGVREPVQVARRGDRFMVLDGAHRARAAQALGQRTLQCRLIDLPDDAPVDGWIHRLPGQLPLDAVALREDGAGRVVALVSDGGGTRDLRAPLANDGSYFAALHTLSRLYRNTPYERVEAGDPATSVGTEIGWVMPTWGTICELVEDYGLLPAGVTRLSRYLP
ncbi:ParB N-terminal domain-containing protein [Leekyejoonella antrihumi]|uniref:ParB-like N-terminal domain-containing protein n=1 Tax=Leekyejoonella antrihumi TaxID=1660198 RepID=A0A563E157_9MICO|nr:ParB N-terminal domain-containing protein [Leekyejoonella antrihumi]TWP35963.1 hypothetical protein FGL98_12075 [Leekyejoonella antrihumi]